MKEQYVPVRQDLPCPVCGSIKWCLIHRSGKKVICPHRRSNMKYGEENYLHTIPKLRAEELAVIVGREPESHREEIDWSVRLSNLQTQASQPILGWFAGQLGIDVYTLNQFRCVGVEHKANGFLLGCPMQDGSNGLTGIQCRDTDGGKKFQKGSRNGIFVPVGKVRDTVYICEGFSDAACMYSAGHYSIARVSAKTGYEQVVTFVRSNTHIREVNIIADNDADHKEGNVGLVGAKRLQFILKGIVVTNILIPDGYNDVREMYGKEKALNFITSTQI